MTSTIFQARRAGTALLLAASGKTEQLTASIGGSGEVSYYGDPHVSRSMQRPSSSRRLGTAPN